jgi:hypothetical protein
MFIEKNSVGKVLTWDEVSETHKVRNGIYQRNGKLISLLTDFGKLTPCYTDFTDETSDTIRYTGSGRRGDQKLDAANRALISAIETKETVPLFCKLKVGVWEFLGLHQVTNAEYIFDETTARMVWKFTLKRKKS